MILKSTVKLINSIKKMHEQYVGPTIFSAKCKIFSFQRNSYTCLMGL